MKAIPTKEVIKYELMNAAEVIYGSVFQLLFHKERGLNANANAKQIVGLPDGRINGNNFFFALRLGG